jgi:hypothetical protein
MAYAVSHNNYWERHRTNFGQWYVYEVNPNAAAYDSSGPAIAWMVKSPYIGGSASHIDHDNRMQALATRIADGLNNSEAAIELLKRVAPALNSHFSAGIEEREGGSDRRQEKLMKAGEDLLSDISAFLARVQPQAIEDFSHDIEDHDCGEDTCVCRD